MNFNYRFDSRSEEEFKRDIRSRTLRERQLFFQWVALKEKELGLPIKWEDKGCDNSGKFLENRDVSTEPDFWVEGYDLLEVKYSDPLIATTSNFHLKVSHVNKYIKLSANVLMINGAATDNPQWTLLGPKDLNNIKLWCCAVKWFGFGGKMSFEIPVNLYQWQNLKSSL